MKNKNKIVKLTLVIVLLLGVVFILAGFLTPQYCSSEKSDLIKTILISVGCSLLATAISSFILMQSDNQSEIMDLLTKIDASAEQLLGPEYVKNVLKEVGIDGERYRKNNLALEFPKGIKESDIVSSTEKALNKFKIEKPISIGYHRPAELKYYYDLIGGTCDARVAEFFALLLSSYWAVNCADSSVVAKPDFDFVVTPKGGSPVLGYEFAKLINKPFVLHEETSRFKNEEDMRAWFNCSEIPEKGSTALIVDDSTTGGSKVTAIIEHLKRNGYAVHTCFVVFEPKVKDARTRLSNLGVQLVSLVETHTS